MVTEPQAASAVKMTNLNDGIREKMLQYFCDRNKAATSFHGKRGASVGMRDLKNDLKQRHVFTQAAVVSNLTYLLDKGWVAEETKERDFTTPRGVTVSSERVWFKITSAGIDRIEGPSSFKAGGKFSGINISAVGANVVTLGNGNVVNADFEPLGQSLAGLRDRFVGSTLSDGEKLSVAADIDAMEGQLAKSAPSKNVVAALWDNISRAADLAGLGQVAAAISPAVARLLM